MEGKNDIIIVHIAKGEKKIDKNVINHITERWRTHRLKIYKNRLFSTLDEKVAEHIDIFIFIENPFLQRLGVCV